MKHILSVLRSTTMAALILILAACASSAGPTIAPTANNSSTVPVGTVQATSIVTMGATATAPLPVTGATSNAMMPAMGITPSATMPAMGAAQTTITSVPPARPTDEGTPPALVPTPTPIDLSQYPNAKILTDTTWLAAHLNDPTVRVLDVRPAQEYQQGHIPGAVNVPVSTIVATVNNVPFMFDQNSVQQALNKSGLTPDMTAVIYDNLGMLDAARMFWTLDYVGHKDARILDGGWNAWNADKRQVVTTTPQVQPSQYPIHLVSSKVITEQELLQHLNDPNYIIVDARSPEEYSGKLVDSARGGHIPGAINLTWLNDLTGDHLVDTTQPNFRAVIQEPEPKVFLPAKQLQSTLNDLGISKNKTVVTYCQTFWRGAQVYFMLRLMGYNNVRGYDGSWAQWGSDPNVPITQGFRP